MKTLPAALAAAAFAWAAPVLAQLPQTQNAAASHVAAQPSAVVLADGSVVGPANPLPTRDANGAAVSGFIAISGPGVTVAAGRGFAASCTGAGAVSVQAPDGSSLSVLVNVGFNQFGFAVVQVLGAGTTATCTYANLK